MQTQTINTKLSPAMQAKVQELYQNAQECEQAIGWLEENGFIPVAFICGRSRKPLIEIETTPACFHILMREKGFSAYHYISRFGKDGYEQVWRATVFNCFVQWIERSH